VITTAEAALEPLEPVAQFGPLIGRSATMRALFKSLVRVAASNTTLLIQAESGTGKELAARAIHQASPRASKPYVVFDCGAVAPTLIESALFGHEKGAFSGATHRRLGCFEEAHGGTLFIDEVGDLPLELQPRLLRAIESREIRRVGGDKPVSVDVRVIAATHRDLAQGVNSGQFREDLYYRVAVVRLRIPPLRERLEDLKLLVEHLVRQAVPADDARATAMLNALNETHWAALRAHPWRGNVRELRNAVERAVTTGMPLCATTELAPAATLSSPAVEQGETFSLEVPFLEQKQQLLERFEKQYLQAMLARHEGNFTRAAAQAGIDRMYFKRLLAKWGLSRDGTA
jgi:two-component system response regulator GlrR